MAKKPVQESIPTPKLAPLKVLEEVINILIDEDNWCRGAFARDGLDERCNATDPIACKYCVLGAIRAVTNNEVDAFLKINNKIIEVLKVQSTAIWNDSMVVNHAEMIAGLQKVYNVWREEA